MAQNNSLTKSLKKHYVHILMLLPGLIVVLLFCYGPMYGVLIAFKDYKMTKGILGSDWVGLKYFMQMFKRPQFINVLWNTIIISFSKLLFGFPVPVIFALLLNEIKGMKFKKVIQTVSYLPHFVSWVVLGGIFINLLSLTGPVNEIRQLIGLEPIIYMAREEHFRSILIITSIWKSFGWGSIIYFAALSGVDPSLYEAATIDGANRFQKAWYISIPCISSVVIIMLILNMGNILNAGFDQVFNMYNPSVYSVSDIIDTYVYRVGLEKMQYSFSTAVNLFKSIIALGMVLTVNRIAKFVDEEHTLW
ncbi:ABC transporter permease [Vallitalea okinawensis]|uniref:ABC transporter permease n=1 Tax=Vallitalea okinawensis TaxID=2078660 RepID=UPI000CFB1A30|nr:ABC transporter permease subunit [Vallitalea okinawensis]